MKKRVVSLILCICLLASTAVLFSSCGKKEIEFSEDYSVIYANDVSDSMAGEIQTFTDALKQKTDSNIKLKKIKTDAELTDAADLEILIGNTNRPETEKALKKIKGHGYIITVLGSKLVIVGTTNFLTNLALDCFTETYLSGEGTVSSLSIEKTEVEKLEMLEFTNKWAFIHSSYLDGDRDYINGQVTEIKSLLGTFSDVRGTPMQQLIDTSKADLEVLVGIVEREESKALLSGMDANNYGIGAKNGKLLVLAQNDGMIAKAFTLFRDMLRDSVCVVENEKAIFVPADFTRIYTDSESAVVTDFPRPEGLTLSGTIDVHDGMEYYYEGDGVTAAAYNAYCQSLVSAGYTAYTDNTAENSIFRTYVNTEKNITLYVAYNDFKHAGAQGTEHKKAIRIVASALDSVNLLEEELLTQDLSFTKLQNSSITAVPLNYMAGTADGSVYGNIYVVTLEDGSFVVLDGGMNYTADRDRLYTILLDLYKRGHGGQEPTTADPIRIAAWYLSHGHGDHYAAMKLFIEHYCAKYNTYKVTLDRLIANFASDEEYYNSEDDRDPGLGSYNSTVRDNYAEYSAKVSDAPGEEPGFKYIKVHTGQRFWLANVEFEVMHTHEDQYPRRIHVYNNTTVVIRMNIHHTVGGVASANSETSMLWLGDAQENASKWMRATWGEYIQSDMVQIAHHGWNGCEWSLYKLIAPTSAWLPNSKDRFNSSFNNDKGAEIGAGCTRNIIYNLSSVQYIILSDVCNYTVTITASGADYSIGGSTGVFNAGGAANVVLRNVSANTDSGFMKTRHNKS